MSSEATTQGLVRFEVRDGVSTLTLDDPARMNALSPAMLRECQAALARVHDDRSVRVFVLAGNGRAFCAGADLSAIGASRDGGGSSASGAGASDTRAADIGTVIHDEGNRLIAELRALPVPTLASVSGAVAGGGVALALACDVVVAARSAYFYSPFVPALGLIPDLGTAWFAQRAAGRARSLGASLLGSRIGAEQALQWGLIWACVDDAALADETKRIAAQLAGLSPAAVVATRESHDLAQTSSLAEQLAWERRKQPELIAGGGFAEGVRAFLGKRKPAFPGR